MYFSAYFFIQFDGIRGHIKPKNKPIFTQTYKGSLFVHWLEKIHFFNFAFIPIYTSLLPLFLHQTTHTYIHLLLQTPKTPINPYLKSPMIKSYKFHSKIINTFLLKQRNFNNTLKTLYLSHPKTNLSNQYVKHQQIPI